MGRLGITTFWDRLMADINLPLILIAALIAVASPGPSTLAIAATSVASGRTYGLAMASGVTVGSFSWSITAAMGLGAVMSANAWMFEILRYFGAGYLLYLAYKSARSAIGGPSKMKTHAAVSSLGGAFGKGLALHLANPKAVLFFGALFAIGVPAGASVSTLLIVIASVGLQSLCVFHGYALLFSNPVMVAGYMRMRRGFEAVFAVAFGAAGVKILTTKIE